MPVILIAALGTYLLCWQGYKLRERLNGLGHAGILISLGCTLLNAASARASDAYPHSLYVGQFISLGQHVLVAGSCLGLYLLRLAVEGHTIHDRPVRRTIAGGVLFCFANAAVIAGAITRGRLLSPTVQSYQDPLGFLHAFGSGCYYGTVMLLVAIWMWRYVADQPPRMRRGMRIAAVGLFGIAALCFVRAIPVLVVFLGGPPRIVPHWVLGTVSAMKFPLVFVGLSYPLLASRWDAFQQWRSRRTTCQRARLTAHTCRAAYPEIELRPAGIRERVQHFISNHHAQARLVVESFDGLAKLLIQDAPLTTPAGLAAAERLRAAVRRYDTTHLTPVAAIISPEVDQRFGEGIPSYSPGATERDIALVLALAAELRAVATTGHQVPA